MAIIHLLLKSDLTEDKVNFSQTIQDVQILPHINRVLKFQLKNELQTELHTAVMALDGLDDSTWTPEQQALYTYYVTHIKDYCIVQAWHNHLEVGDVHVTPAGKRQFSEPQSTPLPDGVFAGFVSNAFQYLSDVRNAMLSQLQADEWTIDSVKYNRDTRQAESVAEGHTGISVILPPKKCYK